MGALIALAVAGTVSLAGTADAAQSTIQVGNFPAPTYTLSGNQLTFNTTTYNMANGTGIFTPYDGDVFKINASPITVSTTVGGTFTPGTPFQLFEIDDATPAHNILLTFTESQITTNNNDGQHLDFFVVGNFHDAGGNTDPNFASNTSGSFNPAGSSTGGTTFTVTANLFSPPFNEVPEPGTIALLGAGLFGLGLARRRRA